MKTAFVAFSLLLMSIAVGFAQKKTSRLNYAPPSPVVGWDSLQKSIKFPDFARRAGFDGEIWAQISFGSTGKVNSIDTKRNDPEILVVPVLDCIKALAWHPAKLNKRKAASVLLVPFIFVLKIKYSEEETTAPDSLVAASRRVSFKKMYPDLECAEPILTIAETLQHPTK